MSFENIRVGRAAHKRGAVLAATALTFALLGTGVASAQSGGTPPPGGTEPPPTTITPPPSGLVFPIPPTIPHTYGDTFGASRGKRSHQGVDVFAACNSTLISASNGKVVGRGYQGSAGNYVIIRWKWLKQDYVYYHMAAPAAVANKTRVLAGQYIGHVGDSGNASGCHLHFEIWQGKWYRGGAAIDPLPSLQLWDSYS